MTDLENPENLEVFDICVHAKKRLLRGDLDQTSDLLQRIIEKVDEKKSTYIVKLIELIEQYETGLYEQNATEYLILWQQWHQNSQSYYQNYKSNFIKEVTYADKIDNEILSMYGILAGVEEHLREWSHESGRDWLNSIIGTILFTRPQILVSQLNSLAQDIGSYTKDNLATPEEQHFWPIYSSLIMGAFDDALDEMGDYFWLQTHLGHALIANGTYFAIAQPTDLAEQDQEKESPLLDPVYHSIHSYAMMLAQDFDMWNEAVTYISCCSLNKEYWTEQLLGNPPLPTKDSTYLESILETAEYYHLRNVVARINYELGRRCEKANNIHEATVRYALASDTPSLDRMARQLLDIYLERRTLQSIVTDEEYHGIKLDLKTKSNHYKALLDYNHFRGELAAKKWSDAAKSSALLIRNEYLPKQFKAVLMVDIMQILEDSQHHFTAKQMRQFIDLFHELTENSKTEALVAEYYQQTRNTQSVCKDIIARIRERISYKAATAPENLA
ncbi:nucleoporin Nup85-like protein [Mycotypha africana]|uniref:nucleoporin Nup85-like protein n=1 Tax=Mycotypha africana TaxID=64632 RepID=UPI002301AC49|nr:nucleoporin Nup85-like protein [Mycotypha africana]KAI8968979.1 nucleoporin Nup85-like protein [Mycotypha africana]